MRKGHSVEVSRGEMGRSREWEVWRSEERQRKEVFHEE
jgi:hypothetical protein